MRRKSGISFLILVLANCLLASSLGSTTELESNESGLHIPFEQINGLIIISASLEDVNGNFILDTGANGLIINTNRRDLSSENFQSFQSSTGHFQANTHSNLSLSISGLVINTDQAFSTDLSNIEEYLDNSIDGIIGADIFENKILHFNFILQEVSIISSEANHAENDNSFKHLDIHLDQKIPIVESKINGMEYRFALDSGASSHFIDPSQLADPSVLKELAESKIIYTAQSKINQSKKYLLNDFSFKDNAKQELAFYNINLDEINKELEHDITGILSLNQLAQDQLILDFPNSKVYFK